MVPGYDVYSLPPTRSVRTEVRAKLRDGSEFVMFRVPDSRPSNSLAKLHQRFRLKLYLFNISHPEIGTNGRSYYLRWVARIWNAENPPDWAVESVEVLQFSTNILNSEEVVQRRIAVMTFLEGKN